MKKNKILGIIGGLSIAVAGVAAVVGGLSNKGVEVKAETSNVVKRNIFFKPNSNWLSSNAWFAACFSKDGSNETWVKLNKVDNTEGLYGNHIDNADQFNNVKFVRMNSDKSELSWDSKWNCSNGQSYVYTITNPCFYYDNSAWDDGNCSVGGPYNWHYVGNVTGWDLKDEYEMYLDDEAQFKLQVNATAGDEFKLVYNKFADLKNWYGDFSKVEDGAKTYVENSNGNIKFKRDGKFDVFLKTNGMIWISITNDTLANDYGKLFLETITCNDGVTAPSTDAWAAMSAKYNELSIDVQGILWLTEGDESGNDAQKSMARYDYIVAKYGTTNYNDFINRQANSSARNVSQPVTINNAATWIIVAVSLAGLTAIGGFFYYKKRKEN